MIFANLFYWGTNQYVIQRTLGAKSLAEARSIIAFHRSFIQPNGVAPISLQSTMDGNFIAIFERNQRRLMRNRKKKKKNRPYTMFINRNTWKVENMDIASEPADRHDGRVCSKSRRNKKHPVAA